MKIPRALKVLREAIKAADEKQGVDIVAMDVRKLTALTDYFLFIGATSHIHVKTLEDVIREKLKTLGGELKRTDGSRGHPWRVLDYGDFIVHIINQEKREFYSLERLWNQGTRIKISQTAKPKTRKKTPLKKRSKKTKKK